MSDEKALATRQEVTSIAMGKGGVQLRTMEDAYRFAVAVIRGGLAPRGMSRPEQVLVAIQAGAELGFTPMRSLSELKVINGRAGPMTRAAKALILERGVIEPGTQIEEWVEGEGEEMVAYVRSQRRGWPKPTTHMFSWKDAVRAGLTGSDTYKKYPQRMLLARARGFHFDDVYPDVLLGMQIAEVLEDYPRPQGATAHDAFDEQATEPDLALAMLGAGDCDVQADEVDLPRDDPFGDEPPVEAHEWTDGEPANVCVPDPEPLATRVLTLSPVERNEIAKAIRQRAKAFVDEAAAYSSIERQVAERFGPLDSVPSGQFAAVRAFALNAKVAK